jgi:Mechanosensitive ion channel
VPGIAAADSGGTLLRSAQSSGLTPFSSRPTSGILGTIARVSELAQKRHMVGEIIARTDQLAMTSQSLLTPLASELNGAFQDPELLAAPLASNDLGQLQRQAGRLKALMDETEKISPAITALAKQRILLTLDKSRLAEWNTSVANQYRSAWKDVMFQGAALCGALGIVIAINMFLRKVTSSHVHDGNGRHAILVGQRVVLWLSLSVIAFSAFALDLKSLATFLGIASAGLAVAMQNVILAIAGYFLLVGKLRIRIGDRVQISGVNGEVIDIGLLQFRLRELGAAGDPPAGRIVSFSNSFIFLSPATGLFKETDVPQHNINS